MCKSGDYVYAFEFSNIKFPVRSAGSEAGKSGENWTTGLECIILFSLFKYSPPQVISYDYTIDKCSMKKTWKL